MAERRPDLMFSLYGRPVRLFAAFGALLSLTLWLIGTPAGVMGKAVAVGYAICHRIAERSFFITETLQMPLCARCTGIYLGAAVGAGVLVARRRLRADRLPPWPITFILIGFGGLMALDGANSYLTLFPGYVAPYSPHNIMRLVTGMLAGLALINILIPMFNSAVWAERNGQRSLDSLADLAIMLIVGGGAVLLVLSERPLILWVMGVISAAGVLVLLSMVGAVLFLSFTRRQGVATHPRQLITPLLMGLTIALIEIGAITIFRFALTGAWEGFRIA